MDAAARYSRECKMDTITVEGDQVSRQGGFEGGYHDESRSRINAFMRMRDASQQIQLLSAEEKSLNAQIAEADIQV